MLIRTATAADWPQLWPIIEAVVDRGDTYVWRPTPSSDAMREIWLEPEPWHVVVALEHDRIIGTAKCGPNRSGRGVHVATASFMVDPAHRGHGVGRVLGEYILGWARDAGYHGMQFNAVVETNTDALSLWESLGFSTVGVVPEAFDHPTLGLVGLTVMYRKL
jgi:GNAT superfamily N-acetyltransferase